MHLLRIESASWAQIVSQPDAFRFYRPVAQASLKLESQLHGSYPPAFRAVNIALHAAVLAMAIVVARLLLVSEIAASLAALAFALTPKAAPIVVLWISGRAELLMALFTFAAVASWTMWCRQGGAPWLAVTMGAYALAALSKETAFMLPLVLLFVAGERQPRSARLIALASLIAIGVALFMWRSHVGAMTPLEADAHYDLLTGIGRIVRSLRNYIARMLPVPLALLILLNVARAIEKRQSGASFGAVSLLVTALVLPLVWIVVFLAPVLPIVARSEIYLYLPAFGVCLLTALFGQLCFMTLKRHRALLLALGVFVAAVGGYQLSRAVAMSRDLQFSARLVAALQADSDLAAHAGDVTLVPAERETEQHLRDSIGGYLYAVLRRAFPDGHVTGTVEYPGMTVTGVSRRVICRFQDGRVTLMHEQE